MARRLIRGGSKFEDLASFSRAVVDGDMIYVSGTTGLDPATGKFSEDVVAQTEMAFRHIETALKEAGASLADVLRVVVYLADRSYLMPVCEVVGRKFKDVRPANTTVIAQLAVPDMKVEIEVTARRGSAATERETQMADQKPSVRPIRRVVTGHDQKGTAKVVMDGQATNAKYPAGGVVSTLIWSTDETPGDIAIGERPEDYGARLLGTQPPANGTRFAVIDFPPGTPGRMHRTESIDYVIVLAGEIEMDMDDSTVHLKAGDVMVQRGTNHSWVNRSSAPARVAFVLIDAKPLGIGHPVARGAQA